MKMLGKKYKWGKEKIYQKRGRTVFDAIKTCSHFDVINSKMVIGLNI